MPDGRLMEEAGVQAVIKGLGTFKSGAKEMDQAIAGIGRAADKAKPPVSRLQKSFADLEAKAAKAIIPLAAVSAVLVATVGKMTMTAARTQELAVVVENMGRVAGYSEEQLSLVEKEIKDLGITTQSARTIMTRFIGAELDLADASKIARAAQDLAVIAMQDSSEAASNLTYAIASMQPRILRQYGLFINLNKVYEETSIALNKQVDELTETEKRQGFLNAVLKGAASYAGTYEAAMGTAGKQLRSFRRYTEEISNELGQHFLPYMGEAVGFATKLAKAILALSDEQKEGVSRVLMYATAMSTMATAMAAAILMAGKLKAALVFLLSPYVLVAAAIGFLVVRAIEWRMELRKLEDELVKTTKTSKEYVRKMADIRHETEKAAEATDQFRRDGGVTTIMLREQRKEIEATNDALRWLVSYYQESGWAAAEMGEHASRALGLTGEYIAKADAAADEALESIRAMGQAFYGNVLAIQDNITAYDELENKVVTVFANTAAATRNFQVGTQRAEEDAALRREELLEKHAEKMHWVATGAHARTKKENEEAFAHWAAINAEEVAEFDAAVALKQERRTEDYDHAIATANAAAAERTRIAEEQRAAELLAMEEAQKERLALLALEMIAAHETLTIMSPWGELEVSAQEYYEAISSGIVPVSEAMKKNLGTAIGFIDDQMSTANQNILEGYSGWQDILGEIVPDVMELGTTTKKESEAMSDAMKRRLRPAIDEVYKGIEDTNEKFGVWAVESGVATDDIGESLEDLEKPMDFVQTKIGETEKFYGEEMAIMQESTIETFNVIGTTIDETLTGVQTAFEDTLVAVHGKLEDFKPKFRKGGRELVQALINGIRDKEDAASRAMMRLVRKMIEAAEEAAGTSSPSTVFMGMGRDVVAGFIQGIQSMQPALDAQMQIALMPAIQVAAPQSAASPVMVQGGHTFNYNFSAHYAQVQSPASIMDDLQAVEMLVGARG